MQLNFIGNTGVDALNTRHPLLIWFLKDRDEMMFTEGELEEIEGAIVRGAQFLEEGNLIKYLDSLKKLHNLPPHLAPPTITDRDFLPQGVPAARKTRAKKKRSKRALK